MKSNVRGFFQEFKSFAVKGNAFELAIAVVIGNAFTGVVNSLVADLITPFIGMVTNHVDFKALMWEPYPGLLLRYGNFIQAVMSFLIVAVSIFVVFKIISSARRNLFERGEEKDVPKHEKPDDVRLLEEIRDLLRQKEDIH